MKDAEIKPAQVMPSLSTLCESSFIGFHEFPVYNNQVKDVVRREKKERTMDVRTMDAVIGLMSISERLFIFKENKYGHQLRSKRKASSTEPEFQVFLVENKRAHLICEVYPERDT